MMRLNTGQRLALNLDSHIAVDAGAGTGKTRTIVERVIQHYLSRRQRATEILPVPERPQRISLSRVRNNTDKLTDPTDWKGAASWRSRTPDLHKSSSRGDEGAIAR